MSHFPIVLIPDRIQRIQQELPPIPKFTDRPPPPPGAEPQPFSWSKTAIEIMFLALLLVGTSLIYRVSSIAGTISFLIGLVLIFLFQYLRIKTYRQSLQRYNVILAAYFKSLDTYARKQAQHEINVSLASSADKIREHRRTKLLEYLDRAIASVNDTDSISQNVQHSDFGKILVGYFPNRIRMGCQIELSNQILMSDFIYIDPVTHLHIAIAVNGSSDRDTQALTPNLISPQDREFNRHLLDAGWIVMRFSESQITRSPDSCCKAIAALLDRLWGMPELMHKFADVPDLPLESQ